MEVKNNHAHVTTQRILNKFMEINFSVGCMVWLWWCLFQPMTTSKNIDEISSPLNIKIRWPTQPFWSQLSPSSSILLQYITAGAECYTFTFLLAQFNDKWSSKFSTLLILLIFAPMSIFYSSIRTAKQKMPIFQICCRKFLWVTW